MQTVDLDADSDAIVVLTVEGIRRAYTRQTLLEALAAPGGLGGREALPAEFSQVTKITAAQLGRSLAWLANRPNEQGVRRTLLAPAEMERHLANLLPRFDGVLSKHPGKIAGLLVSIAMEGPYECCDELITKFSFEHGDLFKLENVHAEHKELVGKWLDNKLAEYQSEQDQPD